MYYAFEHSESNWNLEVLVFKGEAKTGVHGENLSEQRNFAHIWSELRIEPGPHRWEASALTTALALLPICACILHLCKFHSRSGPFHDVK